MVDTQSQIGTLEMYSDPAANPDSGSIIRTQNILEKIIRDAIRFHTLINLALGLIQRKST